MESKFWSYLFGVVMAAAFLLFLVAPLAGWWLPRNVSTFGGHIDGLFYLILGITGFFFVLTEAILVYSLYRFAGGPGRKADYSHGNHQLEIIWTIIPAAILLFLALWQISVWADVKYPAKIAMKANQDALQVEVSARQWEWRIRYPSTQRLDSWQKSKVAAENDFKLHLPDQADDVHRVNELHVWRGANVLVHLKTQDVLHSFFLPQLRLKQDALPGKTIPVWFNATESNTEVIARDAKTNRPTHWAEKGYDVKTGKAGDVDQIFELACAEFCGARHSLMRGKLYVHETKEDFLAWLAQAEYEEFFPTKLEPTARAAAGR